MRRRIVRRPAPLSLSARVERLEKTLLFKPRAPAAVAGQRFTKLCSDGTRWMDAQDGTHIAVHDAKTGLTWSAEPLQSGKNMNHADGMKACSTLDLLGKKDWRAPTIEELLSIVDYARCDPAVDPEYFNGPYGWTWSSTIAAAPAGDAWLVNLFNGNSKAPAGDAWLVNLFNGNSNRNVQTNPNRVRAVRADSRKL
jgi:hypothetical protein